MVGESLFKYLVTYLVLQFFWRSCSVSAFILMNNGPLKGRVSNFLSCFINNYLTYLLLRPHARHFSFKYGSERFLGIWKDLHCWCLHVFLWICWRLFGTFWWWEVLKTFMLTIGPIMVDEWSVDISTSSVLVFKRNIQLWCEMKWKVGVSEAFFQIIYALVQI